MNGQTEKDGGMYYVSLHVCNSISITINVSALRIKMASNTIKIVLNRYFFVWLSDLLILSVPDEDYSGNLSFALKSDTYIIIFNI